MLTTAHKMLLAKAAARTLLFARGVAGLPPEVDTTRRGIRWRLDLREGIDLSIYLLGVFEHATQRAYRRCVRPGDTVVDIGANVGAHTLPFARLVGETGRVLAFEPTAFAFRKLAANIALNEALSHRIVSRQAMLVAHARDDLPPALYASWHLFDQDAAHPKHKGHLMPTTGASTISLDAALAEAGVARVDLIKLDVDGHEHEVLAGATDTLTRHQPIIVMELAPYLFRDQPGAFDTIVTILRDGGYSFHDLAGRHTLPLDTAQLEALIPDGASRNIIASVTPPGP